MNEASCAKEPRVLRLLTRVADTAAQVNQSAKQLSDRTMPIAEQEQEVAGCNVPIEPTSSAVASQLIGIRNILEAADATLQSILQRLEI